MAGFNEDTRVKVPALMHLTRIGYTYRSLHDLHLDPTTNIDVDTFTKKLKDFNKDITDSQIKLFIGQIQNMLNNEDLGREFYEKVLQNKIYKVINYDNAKENTWECVTEMPCENANESFRPDITLLINGMPLVFIEVKKPNNKGGMQAEYHRMNDTRLPNSKFRRFLNLTQLMIFSDNKPYDFTTPVPLQGAFYGCRAEKQMIFNVFREETDWFVRDFPYNPLSETTEIPTNPSKEVRSTRRDIIREAYKQLLSKLNGKNFIRNDFLNENIYIIWKESFQKASNNATRNWQTTCAVLKLPEIIRMHVQYSLEYIKKACS